jgi:hypothetical protein
MLCSLVASIKPFLTSKRHGRGAWGLVEGGEGLVSELQVLCDNRKRAASLEAIDSKEASSRS